MALHFSLTEEKPFHAGEVIDLNRQLEDLYTSIESFGSEVLRLDGVIDNVHTALEHLGDPNMTDEKTAIALFNADRALEMLCGVTESKLTAKMACEALDAQKKTNWEKFKNFCKQLWEKIKVFLRDLFSLVGKSIKVVEEAIKDGKIDFEKQGTFYDYDKLSTALQESDGLEVMANCCFKCIKKTNYYGAYTETRTETYVDPELPRLVSEACANKKFFKFNPSSSSVEFDKSYLDRTEGTLKDHGWDRPAVERACKDYPKYEKGHAKIVALINNMSTFFDRLQFSNPTTKLGFSISSKSYSAMCSVMRAYYHAIGDLKRCIKTESDYKWE